MSAVTFTRKELELVAEVMAGKNHGPWCEDECVSLSKKIADALLDVAAAPSSLPVIPREAVLDEFGHGEWDTSVSPRRWVQVISVRRNAVTIAPPTEPEKT